MNIFSRLSTILDTLGVSPVVSNEHGFIARMPDVLYRSIPAQSKHKLDPALQSGTDYEFKKNNPNQKKSAGMSDGQLLHLLTLEPHVFSEQYHVGRKYESVEGSVFLEDSDGLKKFISGHNAQHTETLAAIKQAVEQHNTDMKSELVNSLPFEDLPYEYQTGEVDIRKTKLVLEAFRCEFLTLDLEAANYLNNAENIVRKWRNSVPRLINILLERWTCGDLHERAKLMVQIMNETWADYQEMASENIIDSLPKDFLLPYFTARSKKAAEAAYAQDCKKQLQENGAIIDTHLPVDEQVVLLEQYSSDYFEPWDSQFFEKIPNIGNKKTATEDYGLDDVIAAAQQIYPSLMYVPKLRDDEQKCAAAKNLTFLSPEQADHGQRIVNAVRANADASRILDLDDNEFEICLVWKDEHGVTWKAKADVLNRSVNVMADIKFVSSADFNKLSRDSSALNYHIQNAIYEHGFNHITSLLDGEVLNAFYLIIVEKDAPELGKAATKPVRVRVVEYDRPDVDRGLKLAQLASLSVLKWEETGDYDGFYGGIRHIKVPTYQRKEEEMLISHMEDNLKGYSVTVSDCSSNEPEYTSAETSGVASMLVSSEPQNTVAEFKFDMSALDVEELFV
ncbi:PD-(D/E)XK nuclease-like domain-containing protein [Vibrio fluvialis]|nr:PD-(D/E)XK nuclease-like domain-containing protein [Vibrio fluvialis]